MSQPSLSASAWASCKLALALNSTLSDCGPIKTVEPSNLWIKVALGFDLGNSYNLLSYFKKE